ncbi:MAG TPA: MBL fold metallo-hydrolase [Baekduia sp.]|uniref:MBL fold metallo-hydrolase n=1 Tax=Baekduia sp. TaxID=2600305 RepID=UPI002C603D14|nr:MBL fold metallo-hydrolase [Baekduia sp.]HMJ35700.1 MBL fold metallo-hydrolase [Baekduia sp.]
MEGAATILGSGGFIPTGRRETSSLLIRPAGGDTAIVVDAGTGIRRLITDRALLEGRTRVEVLLTHFHLDHVCGLAYLTELGDLDVSVRGPGAALYATSTADVLARLFTHPIMPVTLPELGIPVGELAPGEAEVGGVRMAVRRQDRHTDPTLGLRFGDALVWCTDTQDDPGTVGFARGARILAHDAWGPPAAPGHAEPAGAARIAVDAGAEHLVLIHVPPTADEADLRARAAAVHGAVTVAADGLELLDL